MPEGLIQTTNITGVDGQLIGSANGTYYCGFTMRETAAATATIEVRDGSATGKILDEIPFAASEGVSDYYGDAPLWVDGKIFVHVVAGTVAGAIRWR